MKTKGRCIKDHHDAFGHEIYDYWKGNRDVFEIVERDDGYIDISGGPSFYFADFKNWPVWQKRAIRLARGRVLDIGCGAGRCLLYLQKKGLDVVGLDNSPLAARVCRERGIKQVYVRPITQIGPDMGIFNTIIMYGNNFGLFGNYKRAKWLLKKMYKITSEKSRIIAEVCDPYRTELPEHLWYHKFNRRRGRMGGQLRLRIRYKKYVSHWFDYLFVTRDELRDILDGTGWLLSRTVNSGSGPYIAVIEKE